MIASSIVRTGACHIRTALAIATHTCHTSPCGLPMLRMISGNAQANFCPHFESSVFLFKVLERAHVIETKTYSEENNMRWLERIFRR
jgi:hypothetical protein